MGVCGEEGGLNIIVVKTENWYVFFQVTRRMENL